MFDTKTDWDRVWQLIFALALQEKRSVIETMVRYDPDQLTYFQINFPSEFTRLEASV